MKLKGLFAIMAAALMLSMSFTSCEELDGLFDDENESTDNQAFFPNTYRQRTVAAWYSLTEKEENGTRIEAVFLFDDNSFVTTKSRTYTDGRSQERKILAEGDYTLTGDYENGTAEVKINGAPEPMTVEIKDGKMLAMGETFTKQSNKKVPKPSEESEGGDGGQGGDGDGGQSDGLEAFFPTAYAGKSVSAWYTSAGEIEEQEFVIKCLGAMYFFDDNTCVITTNAIAKGPDGQVFYTARTIGIEGNYSFLKGDFENGQIEMLSNGRGMIFTVQEGKISVETLEGFQGPFTIFTKQDNSKVPQPLDPTDQGQHGGDGGGVQAFFPSSYASKSLLIWYKYTEVKDNSTRVEAVFLFADGTFVTTKHKVYSKEDGRSPEREIIAEGAYSLISGDYQDGVLRGILANGETMDITIENGIMKANGDDFAMQDATELPEPSDPTNNGQQGGEGQGGEDQGNEVPAFFPKAYAEKTVVAWYSFSEGEKGETRVEAVFLFENDVVIVTENKVFAEELGMGPERYIKSVGSYKLRDGDSETGLGIVELSELGQHQVKIEKGVLTVDGLYGEYIKRALADIPDPLDPTDQGQQGGEGEGQGGEGQGGEGQGGEGGEVQYNGDPTPYLPAQYADKTIAAWYLFDNVGNGTVRYECVFLFTDGSLVVTKSKFYNIGDGREPEYGINASGQYRMSEGGDFENGTASVVTADGMTMEVSIQDGILSAMNTEFEIQDNDDAPAPLKL